MSKAPFPTPTPTWHTETYPSLSPTRPELSAKGKSLLITGGGSGIGAETARYFAAAGASRIALLGRREQPLLDTKADIERKYPGVEVFTVSADIAKQRDIDTAFENFAVNGKIDVLVHSAAMIGPKDAIKTVDAEPFLSSIDFNLRGSLYVAQAFLRHASKNAVAIEINSSAAHVTFGDVFGAYSIAKLAVFRLWDMLAFANPDLSVFHVQPGVVNTDMNKEAGGVAAMGFEDHVNLPASFNLWLASREAEFLKGKYLWANWDVDELKLKAKEIQSSTYLNIGLVGWPFGEGSGASQAGFGDWK